MPPIVYPCKEKYLKAECDQLQVLDKEMRDKKMGTGQKCKVFKLSSPNHGKEWITVS